RKLKQSHQGDAAIRKPAAAAPAEPAAQLTLDTPSTTASTDSPSTISVSSPKRSGRCRGWTGASRSKRQAGIGVTSSIASATPQITYAHGRSNAIDTTQINNARLNDERNVRASF